MKEIEEICGKGITYEVDWDSLADDAEALNFMDNISCHRLEHGRCELSVVTKWASKPFVTG